MINESWINIAAPSSLVYETMGEENKGEEGEDAVVVGEVLTSVALRGLQVFLILVTGISIRHATVLFYDSHGWRHRLVGASLLMCLMVGSFSCFLTATTTTTTARTNRSNIREESFKLFQSSSPYSYYYLIYDIVLGILGITATLTAARDFPHKYIQNAPGQSGTLSVKAMVTYNEMIEHAFYQFVNVWQALYLHFSTVLLPAWIPENHSQQQQHQQQRYYDATNICLRGFALFLVTAPWWVRRQFPVHSFSANWIQTPSNKRSMMETLMYRMKKLQYLFYKHVILHGLNLTIFLQSTWWQRQRYLIATKEWRVFWLCLNTSYVMEFFLQSLVRRRVISQTIMLILNRYLMVVSSFAAIQAVFNIVRWDLCVLSLLLNIFHRHHDVTNTMILAFVAMSLGVYSVETMKISNL